MMQTLAQTTQEDYERAYSLSEKYKDKVFYSGVQPAWIGKSHNFWYVRNTPQGKKYVIVDAEKTSRKDLFDHAKLAKSLSDLTKRRFVKDSLNLERLRVSDKADTMYFSVNGEQYKYIIKTDKISKLARQNRPEREERYWAAWNNDREGKAVKSPDNQNEAFIREGNIWIRNLKNMKERQLSLDGSTGEYYSAEINWSPDSKKLVSMKTRPAEQRLIYFVESSPKDQLQPKLHKREYTKPGDALPQRKPVIFDIDNKSALTPPTTLFENQFDLGSLRWNKDSKAVTFEYNARGHKYYRVLEMSSTTGDIRAIVDEKSDTYVNYNRMFRHDMENKGEMIWMSERDNWNHLYMYDTKSGSVKYQITKGEWYVREVLHIDETNRQIWFTANGVNPNEDPYLLKYYRIGFDGKEMTCLTPDEGMHTAWFSEDRKFLVDVYSKTDMPPVAVLRNTKDGSIVMPLEKADISALLATGWKAPETFVAKGRDGKTDIWGLIYRPTNFDPSKKYPVIEYIYSGPGSHYVPKTFSTFNWNMSPLAELGFIVVQLDGMTTSYRSKSFESVCYKNLQDAGFPDRIPWIKSAAAKYPYMDITRVGIFGASAGGQEAMTAVLNYPDFYKAAYSACGCHDNRMDKIWWNEQWMGYPVDESYKAASNVENAYKLIRPLMLVVGEMDDNVDPASTMQVVNALIKANKNFELIVLPGVGHTMGDKYGEHKRYDFFVKNLLGIDPPAWK